MSNHRDGERSSETRTRIRAGQLIGEQRQGDCQQSRTRERNDLRGKKMAVCSVC